MLPFCQIFCLRYHGTVSPGSDSHCHAPPRNVVGHACSTLTLSVSALEISHQRQKSAVLAGHSYWKYDQAKAQGGGGGGGGWGRGGNDEGGHAGELQLRICPLNVGRWLEEEPHVS